MKIGIDIGGVIIDRNRNDESDTSLFGENYLNAYAVKDAFQAIQRLNCGGIFKDQVYVVSKCGHNIERKSREWLAHNKFHEFTGVPAERVRFCRRRSEKAPIAQELGLTHFVDDKLEVLGYMRDVVPNRILFNPDLSEVKAMSQTAGPAVLAFSWMDVLVWLERATR